MAIIRMSEKGQVVVPKVIREERCFGNSSALAVVETKSGASVLRPDQTAPRMDLVEHLLRLKGLVIQERQHLCLPRT